MYFLRVLYTIGIYIARIVLRCLAVFNTKIRLGVIGRQHTFDILESKLVSTNRTIWMHCASLGEFEQGLPVLKALKALHDDIAIVVSFFSPSGYEHKKHTAIADAVVYLPIDTPLNAKRFLKLINPTLILFVKYDIWPNYLLEIRKQKLKALLIAANFREQQSYFKWYGRLMRSALFAFDHIFTQNTRSKTLLNTINYTRVTVSGDTRFDRVSEQLEINNQIPFIETFKGNTTLLIFGSSWPEDDALFLPFINTSDTTNLKFVIAPHNVNPKYTKALKSQITKKCIAYSEMHNKDLNDYVVLILDTIGYLSKAYSYADIAYVGGAAGKTGLHNILEPAVFGIPILIGPHYEKFPEAKVLVEKRGVISVSTTSELSQTIEAWLTSKSLLLQTGAINAKYIKKNKGAVNQIVNYIRI